MQEGVYSRANKEDIMSTIDTSTTTDIDTNINIDANTKAKAKAKADALAAKKAAALEAAKCPRCRVVRFGLEGCLCMGGWM